MHDQQTPARARARVAFAKCRSGGGGCDGDDDDDVESLMVTFIFDRSWIYWNFIHTRDFALPALAQ